MCERRKKKGNQLHATNEMAVELLVNEIRRRECRARVRWRQIYDLSPLCSMIFFFFLLFFCERLRYECVCEILGMSNSSG